MGLEWTGVDGGLYALQGSSDLSHWQEILTQSCHGGVVRAEDPLTVPLVSRRFYRVLRVDPTLELSTNQASVGQLLRLSGGAFDPLVPAWVGFRDSSGQETLVRARRVTTDSVVVAIPALLRVGEAPGLGGPAAVTVQQSSVPGGFLKTQGARGLLNIDEPPATGLPPGTLTLAWLDRVSRLLTNAAAIWETVGRAADGAVDTAPILPELLSLRSQVESSRLGVLDIMERPVSRRVLGHIGGREVLLDAAGLEVLDRLLAAFLAGARKGESGPTASPPVEDSSLRTRAVPVAAGDPLQDLEAFFRQAEGPDASSILASFEQANTIASAGVGILATTAVVLGAVSAPVAGAMAGTAGAVLFFTTGLVPAVMAASSQALAAPFIEVQLGRPVRSLDEYRPAVDHLQKGCRSYLTDELRGRLVNGLFKGLGASEELASFVELYVGTSLAILNLQDLSRPGSVGAETYLAAPQIFPKLAPPLSERSGTFTGTFAGSLTETYPTAGWRHEISGTLTLVVQGQGTVPAPFQGRLEFAATDRISLAFCHEPFGCDPGGVIRLEADDGDLFGAFGTLEGEALGEGGGGGTGSFAVEFAGGVFQGSAWKGSLRLDLGVDQPMTTTVTLIRTP